MMPSISASGQITLSSNRLSPSMPTVNARTAVNATAADARNVMPMARPKVSVRTKAMLAVVHADAVRTAAATPVTPEVTNARLEKLAMAPTLA